MARAGRLPYEPRTFREIVLADLYRGQRLVEKVHPDPIDPQFRIATPEGDWALAVTLPDDARQRARRLQLVSDFMAWKAARAFTITSELHEPDCVYAMGVAMSELHACMSRITRHGGGVQGTGPAVDFGAVEWIDEQAGSDIPQLLPRIPRKLDADRLRILRRFFGAQGEFPAVNLETGAIGAG